MKNEKDIKTKVKEAYRILKKIVISDIVLLKELPDFIKNSTSAYTGCISGAMIKEEYINEIYKAGFKEVKILDESFFSLDCIISDPDINKIKENEKKATKKYFKHKNFCFKKISENFFNNWVDLVFI